MLLYRVAPYLASVTDPDRPGHPAYLHRPAQGRGRLDNREIYDVWYLALTQSGAIGETFFSIPVWKDEMFLFGDSIPGARYALHRFSIEDECPIIDLDDSQTLVDYGLRPTQIVTPNRSLSQRWALKLYEDKNPSSGYAWHGIRWWSRTHSDWPVLGLFRCIPEYIDTEHLSIKHPAVRDAAAVLRRKIKGGKQAGTRGGMSRIYRSRQANPANKQSLGAGYRGIQTPTSMDAR